MNEQFAAYLVTILTKTVALFVFIMIVAYVLGLIGIIRDYRRK